jgi:hypothetical protein
LKAGIAVSNRSRLLEPKNLICRTEETTLLKLRGRGPRTAVKKATGGEKYGSRSISEEKADEAKGSLKRGSREEISNGGHAQIGLEKKILD